MTILGVRTGPKKTRIAIVRGERNESKLISTGADSRLVYPVDLTTPEEKVLWLYREIQRVHNDYSDIEKVCIKTNEYTQVDNKSKRESAYLEGGVLLFCRLKNIPVVVNIYASLSTSKANVMMHAEERVGRTDKYWDSQMADAVVVAWRCLK